MAIKYYYIPIFIISWLTTYSLVGEKLDELSLRCFATIDLIFSVLFEKIEDDGANIRGSRIRKLKKANLQLVSHHLLDICTTADMCGICLIEYEKLGSV